MRLRSAFRKDWEFESPHAHQHDMTYKFSPIKNKEELHSAISYVAVAVSELLQKVTGDMAPITSLSVFSHDDDEYAFLCGLLKTMGTGVGEVNGPRVALHEPMRAGGHTITHLRIRNPDPDKPQVGCADLDVADYFAFKNKNLSTHLQNLKLIVRPDYELIELFDKDSDVLGYVLSQPERSKKGLETK